MKNTNWIQNWIDDVSASVPDYILEDYQSSICDDNTDHRLTKDNSSSFHLFTINCHKKYQKHTKTRQKTWERQTRRETDA